MNHRHARLKCCPDADQRIVEVGRQETGVEIEKLSSNGEDQS